MAQFETEVKKDLWKESKIGVMGQEIGVKKEFREGSYIPFRLQLDTNCF